MQGPRKFSPLHKTQLGRLNKQFFNEGGNRQPVPTVVHAGTTFTG
jgi:hypothetical protein